MTRGGDLQRAVAADRPHLAFLEHAQQPDLQRGRRVADLVEQHRAAAGLLEHALVIRHGARERPALMAEQLRLEQRVGDRAAVDADKRLARARAVAVDRPGDQLLARRRFRRR